MDIQFYGVRGSIPVSGPSFLHTGGHTSCVSVEHEGHRLILDGGTGLQQVGADMGFGDTEATLLFSHVHWDHIQGVPFFGPAFNPNARLTILGACRESGSIKDALAAQMTPPRFPIGLDTFRARMAFVDLFDGQPIESGPFRITPLDVNHPDGVFAYRIEAGGSAVVYATDIEHGTDLDVRLVALAEGADLLIHDAQYTRDEYFGARGPCRVGWGHSMWAQAVEVARLARVRKLALFHHDPMRLDDQVAVIEAEAQRLFPTTLAAREGVRVSV